MYMICLDCRTTQVKWTTRNTDMLSETRHHTQKKIHSNLKSLKHFHQRNQFTWYETGSTNKVKTSKSWIQCNSPSPCPCGSRAQQVHHVVVMTTTTTTLLLLFFLCCLLHCFCHWLQKKTHQLWLGGSPEEYKNLNYEEEEEEETTNMHVSSGLLIH